MPRCFVIQPFDGGRKYDKRYEDVFAPAIEAAGLEPYRVDRDPETDVLIESIEKGIEDSDVCLAEISTDNPNVWFELGFAIASKRRVVLLCSYERDTPFPFDVRHRTIIRYKTSSLRDFAAARSEITERLKAIWRKIDSEKVEIFLDAFPGKVSVEKTPGAPDSVTSASRIGELEPYAFKGLIAVAALSDPLRGSLFSDVRRRLSDHGLGPAGAALAMESLIRMGLLEGETSPAGSVYRVSSDGWDWIRTHREDLPLSDFGYIDVPF